jgi:hypothetical protein
VHNAPSAPGKALTSTGGKRHAGEMKRQRLQPLQIVWAAERSTTAGCGSPRAARSIRRGAARGSMPPSGRAASNLGWTRGRDLRPAWSLRNTPARAVGSRPRSSPPVPRSASDSSAASPGDDADAETIHDGGVATRRGAPAGARAQCRTRPAATASTSRRCRRSR